MTTLLLLISVLALSNGNNLVQTAQDAGLTTLVSSIIGEGLDTTLNGTGPFTVFAPTNDAFAAANLTGLTVSDVLLYHVISGANVSSGDVTDHSSAASAEGTNLFLNTDGTSVWVNGIQVATPNVYADNGVAHVIPTVLIPPTQNLYDAAVSAGFSNLSSFLTAAGLDGLFQNESNIFTVFAPTDAAFGALPACVVDALSADTDELTYVLTYHAIDSKTFYSSNIPSGSTAVITANGEELTVTKATGVDVNGVAVVTADIQTTNGIVHVIGSVLLPPSRSLADYCNTVGLVTAYYPTLASAVVANSLVSTLDSGNFTIFAPTDAALTGLNPDSATLLYHVLPGFVFSTDLVDNTAATTANGNPVLINVKTSGAYVNGILITNADITASNGVLHEIGTVLSPPTGSIFDFIRGNPSFSILEEVLLAADLGSALNGTSILTLFAPTDAAFDEIPSELFEFVSNNVTALTELLTYHVVAGSQFSSFLASGTVTTLQGSTIDITTSPVRVNNVDVSSADILCTNGVIHQIDSVLIPPLFGAGAVQTASILLSLVALLLVL